MSVHAPTRPATAPRTGGPEGNERLTASVAIVLLVLLAVEGVTIVFLGPLLPVHLFVGALLIPPVGLKLASTGWRFMRYYTGSRPYVLRGPPHILLRSTAPVVVLTTVLVLSTGIALLVAGPRHRHLLFPLHKIGFIVWLCFMGLHVLGHLTGLPAVRGDLPGAGDAHALPGRSGRLASTVLALAAGVGVAVALIPLYGAWLHHHH